MVWIMCFISFFFGAMSMLILVRIGYTAKQKEQINNVHFYAARDKNGMLYLYLGKPNRIETRDAFFAGSKSELININTYYLKRCGFNKKDFKNLKWEDEPVEVFLNMED